MKLPFAGLDASFPLAAAQNCPEFATPEPAKHHQKVVWTSVSQRNNLLRPAFNSSTNLVLSTMTLTSPGKQFDIFFTHATADQNVCLALMAHGCPQNQIWSNFHTLEPKLIWVLSWSVFESTLICSITGHHLEWIGRYIRLLVCCLIIPNRMPWIGIFGNSRCRLVGTKRRRKTCMVIHAFRPIFIHDMQLFAQFLSPWTSSLCNFKKNCWRLHQGQNRVFSKCWLKQYYVSMYPRI